MAVIFMPSVSDDIAAWRRETKKNGVVKVSGVEVVCFSKKELAMVEFDHHFGKLFHWSSTDDGWLPIWSAPLPSQWQLVGE